LREITKEVGHLLVAENWLAAADRVFVRLGRGAPKSQRSAIEEGVDTVMWHVRAGEWDGRLTAAVTQLQGIVQEAEAHAANSVQRAG